MEICQRDLGMKSEKLRKRENRYDRMRRSKPCEDNGRKEEERKWGGGRFEENKEREEEGKDIRMRRKRKKEE